MAFMIFFVITVTVGAGFVVVRRKRKGHTSAAH
jgi:hypothetical protein